jgi:hypothetical protein
LGELENEHQSLSAFLESKIQGSITVKKKVLILDSKEKTVPPREVKILVKRFLYHKGLSKTYRVTEEHEAIKITKREHKERKDKEKHTPPSPYDTLPYFFPVHP